MNERITLIGAGSAVFTRGLVADLIRLGVKADLALVDIEPHVLHVTESLTRKMNAAKNAPITVRSSLDRREMLTESTAVICTIGVGGRRAWEQDVFIPRKHGIYAPVGDTVGPGGSSRAVRMVPTMVDIACDVLDLAPGALFFNYSNPMAVICRAAHKATGADMGGLCHRVHFVAETIAEFLGEPFEDIGYTAIGINHLTWFTKVSLRGEDAMPRLRAFAEHRLAAGVPNDPMPTYPFAAIEWPHHNLFSLKLLIRFGAQSRPTFPTQARFPTCRLPPLSNRPRSPGMEDFTHCSRNRYRPHWPSRLPPGTNGSKRSSRPRSKAATINSYSPSCWMAMWIRSTWQ